MARRNRRCPVCKTRRYVKDSNTGFVRCQNGHFLDGVVSENHIVDYGTGHALQKRRLRSGPRTNKRELYGQRDQNYWHGEAAQILRLEALQLLLRLQVKALKELWNLPDVFESYVRDFWTFRLATSPLPSMASRSEDGRDSRPPSPGLPSQKPSQRTMDEKNDSDGSGSDSDLEARFVAEEDQKEDSTGPDDENDLEDTAVDVSDDSDDEGAEKEEGLKEVPVEVTSEKPQERVLTVSDTLTCLALGLWMVRAPFTHVELAEVVNHNQIPFIEFFKSTQLPAEMKKHMNRAVRLSLMPGRSPKPIYLWNNSRRFAHILHRRFGIDFPPLNGHPVVWKIVSKLGGDDVTYSQVLAFLRLVKANLSILAMGYTTVTRNRAARSHEYDRPTKVYDVIMPEISIAAAWVIVMKLAYGLDGTERQALLADDPLIGRPRAEDWVDELEKRKAAGEFDHLHHLKNQPFAAMPEEDIDRFLNAAEDVLLKDREHERWAASNFPLPPKVPVPEPPRAWESWSAFREHARAHPVRQAGPVPSSTRNDELPLMPGEKVRSFEAADVTGTLPPSFEVVASCAAQAAGVELQELLEVIEVFERRIEGLRPKRKLPFGHSQRSKRALERTHTLLRETRYR